MSFPIHLLGTLDLCIGDVDEDWGNYVFVDYDKGDDWVDNDESPDDDIYIMMKCLFVCNEKSSLPPGSLL